jgi:dienelactone hydrolase
MRNSFAILAMVVGMTVARGPTDSYTEFLKHFDYDRTAPLDIQQGAAEDRGAVKVYDLTYASLKGGRVPAFLVVPERRGPFAAVLWGHWAMPGSPTRNRMEFLEEAIVLARAGAVSLLPDAPFARPGYVEPPEQGPFSPESIALQVQQVIDLRRGLDLLLGRKDVDPRRIAYVGHSYNAGIGGMLSGVEKRIRAFVLMAGVLSDEVVASADEPGIVEVRQKLGEKQIRRLMAENRWTDPAVYLSKAAPSAVFIQAARQDGVAGEKYAKQFYELTSQPKKLGIYDASHALNAEARQGRVSWLQEQLRLRPIPAAWLGKLPETK